MDIKKRLGLHIRVGSSIVDVIEKAIMLDLPFFQSFLVVQQTGRMVHVPFADKKKFLELRRQYFGDLFCHGSYWINLAGLKYTGYRAFERECALAKQLEFTHFILHAGTAKGAVDRMQGIDSLVRSLNIMLKTEKDLIFLLENTAHGNLSVGSDILDFKLVLEKLDTPERIGFCIDTAHAHVFGYDIMSMQGQENFLQFLDETIGLGRIMLIHLNDTNQKKGSFLDRHEVVGEGMLGKSALHLFIKQPQLQHIPVLMELPEIGIAKEQEVLLMVRSW